MGTIDPTQVNGVNELIIRLSDRFVYSRTRSSRIQEMADNYSGSARYGRTAFTRAGLKMPDMEDFMRRALVSVRHLPDSKRGANP